MGRPCVTATPTAVHASTGDSATRAATAPTMSMPRLTASAHLFLVVTSAARAERILPRGHPPPVLRPFRDSDSRWPPDCPLRTISKPSSDHPRIDEQTLP